MFFSWIHFHGTWPHFSLNNTFFYLQTLKISQVLIKKEKQAVTENNKGKEMWKHFYIASSFPGTISSYEEGY